MFDPVTMMMLQPGPPCPDCGTPMPNAIDPAKKTRRMWREGGYLCFECGCQTDVQGRKVPSDEPLGQVPLAMLAKPAVVVVLTLAVGAMVFFQRQAAFKAAGAPEPAAVPAPAP